ncbi:MAG: hypothetical protein QOJ03_30 [Frankiaceae bacterium]|nr:hypothetical protein [Frankiaceae bacterium]
MIERMFEDLLEAGATVVAAGSGILRFDLSGGWDDSGLPPLCQPDPDEEPGRREITPTDVLDYVVGGPAGPIAIEMLLSLQGEDLNERDQALLLRGWQKQVSYCEAQALTASLPVADHPLSKAFGAQEVAAVSVTTVTAADRRLNMARRLAAVLTRTSEALLNGDISFVAAQIIHEQTLGLSPDQAREVEAKVLDRAGRILPASLRDAVNRAAAAVDPERFEKQQNDAVAQTDITVSPMPLGMAAVVGTVSAVDAGTIARALDDWADAHESDLPGTTRGQRRVAALTAWARDYLDDPNSPRRHGRRTADTVGLVIDLPTLIGLADHPGEVPGFGPVPAAVARLFAAGGKLRRMVIEPVTGYLLDYGTTTHDVPQELTDFILARETESSFPTSHLPSRLCDKEHATAFPEGGTSADNVGPVDRRGHNAKTHAGWVGRRSSDGSVTWTSPRGLKYRIEPHDYRLGP